MNNKQDIIIAAFLTIEYSLESLCVCFCTIAQKISSRNLEFKYIALYGNNSDMFDIDWALADQGQGHDATQIFLHLLQYKLLGQITQLW